MWSTTKNSKCCATCAYWSGERKVISGGNGIETPHANTNGKCYEKVSISPTTAAMGTSCTHYEKWRGLN